MKRFLVMAMAFAMSLTAFTACGKGDDGEDTPDVKVVKVWVHKSEAEAEGKTLRAIQEAFNETKMKTSDGRTIVMNLEYKNSAEALSTAITGEIMSGGLPDIVAVDSSNITAYAADNVLVALDDYLPKSVLDDYVDSVIEQSTYNGKLYALSGMDAPGGLYYNKALLKEAGYADADFGTIESPWSWKDVEKAMLALKKAGKAYKIKLNLGFGGDEGCMYLYSPLIYSAGGSFFGDKEKVTGSLDSDASIEGLKMLESLFAANSANEWIYSGTNENAFPGGEVAFEIYGPWLVSTISKDYKSFVADYDIMPYPVYESASGKKGSSAAPCGSWGFGVTRDSRDKAAAAQALAYLTGPEASELLYDSIGTFPTHESVLKSSEAFSSGALKSLSEILQKTGTARPKLVNYPKLSMAYSDIVEYIETKAGASDYDLKSYVTEKSQYVDR